MIQYNVRMDGEVLPDTFTYEELLVNNILDFEDIEVKPITQTTWVKIKDFHFPEENESFRVDADGTVIFDSRPCSHTSVTPSSQTSNSTNSSINNSTSAYSTPSSPPNNADSIGYKLLWTFIIIIIGIAFCSMGIIGVVAAFVAGGYVLALIWFGD